MELVTMDDGCRLAVRWREDLDATVEAILTAS